jgi:hypothetical protein
LEANGFTHTQGFVYQRENINASNAWTILCLLRNLEPLGIFASIIKAAQVFHIPHPVMIMANDVALDGQYSPAPIGPTPLNLIPDHVAANPLGAAPNPLPRGVRHTEAALFGPNWAV